MHHSTLVWYALRRDILYASEVHRVVFSGFFSDLGIVAQLRSLLYEDSTHS